MEKYRLYLFAFAICMFATFQLTRLKKIMSRLLLGNGELAFSFKNLWGEGGREEDAEAGVF